MDKIISVFKDICLSLLENGRVLKFLVITGGLFLIYKFTFQISSVISLGVGLIPLSLVITFILLRYYNRIFYLLFISHFLILLISSFVDVRIGIMTLITNVLVVILLIIMSYYRKTKWKGSNNGMLWLYLIWGIYCILEIANPNNVQEAWNLAITYYFVYPVICAILVPLTIKKINHIEWLLVLWSFFVLLAAFKGYWQKTHGFNARELRFLFEEGGAATHLIWSGIRYFSFFTDAANFGVNMAMAILAFGISFFYVKSKTLKVYFAIVILAAIYGMGISGTRSSIAVPLGGLMLFVLLSKNFKAFLVGSVVLIGMFLFFRFTTIGDSNEYIRKMRTAFRPSTDASFNVRVYNRKRMKEYMVHKPFGYGLALGGKGERFRPKEYLPIPPDSWLVNVWADTGIIGLILYLLVHIALFAWCSWILMFQIMNKRLRNMLAAWLCVNAGYFIAAYTNDIMQYPNFIVIYTGFALCFAGPLIDKNEKEISSQAVSKDKPE